MADGTAWRLVSRCTTVEEVVRGFRALASPDGLDGVPVTGVVPAGGAQVRVMVTLASKAVVLDGEAVVTMSPGKLGLRFVKLDARGKGLLAHMVEHREAEPPPPVPRHLVPLGASPGTPAAVRAETALPNCTVEPLVASGLVARPAITPPSASPPAGVPVPSSAPLPRLATTAGPAPAAPSVPPARQRPATRPPPEMATTVRNAGARRDPAPPTLRDKRPPAMAPEVPAAPSAVAAERPKREAQKTLMGMSALSPLAAGPPVASSPGLVVPAGTPPGVPTESVPVPRPRGDGMGTETGPTRPTRGPTEPSPVIVLAAQAIASSAPVPASFDAVPTLPTQVPNIAALVPSRIDAAPSGPVDDNPTIPNDDIQTDVAVALPDLPGHDDVDPVVDPPPQQHQPMMMPVVPPGAIPVYGGPYYQQPPPQPPYYPPPQQYPATAQLPALQVGHGPAPGYDWRQVPEHVAGDDDMTEMVALVRPPRRRWPVIAVTSAVIVIGVAVMAIVAASSEDEPAPSAAPTPAPAPAPVIGTAAPAPAPAVKTGTCEVSFTSSPDAAEVLVDGKVIGKTPVAHAGSCAGFDVTFRRERYQPQTVTVAAGAATADVRLERPSFKVRITSRPPGATVKVGGVDSGKTPVFLQLPGYETTSIELTRNGYAATTQRVYAGKSGQKVDVKLKPRRR